METVRMKRKKVGRPAETIKKEIRACVRFTRPEYFIIKEKASKAEKLGVMLETVSKWCTNVNQPSIATLFKIAEVLEATPCELLVSK